MPSAAVLERFIARVESNDPVGAIRASCDPAKRVRP